MCYLLHIKSIYCKMVRHSIWNGSRAKCNWYFNLFMKLIILQLQRSIYFICVMSLKFELNGWIVEHVVWVSYLTFAMNYDFIIWILLTRRFAKRRQRMEFQKEIISEVPVIRLIIHLLLIHIIIFREWNEMTLPSSTDFRQIISQTWKCVILEFGAVWFEMFNEWNNVKCG